MCQWMTVALFKGEMENNNNFETINGILQRHLIDNCNYVVFLCVCACHFDYNNAMLPKHSNLHVVYPSHPSTRGREDNKTK